MKFDFPKPPIIHDQLPNHLHIELVDTLTLENNPPSILHCLIPSEPDSLSGMWNFKVIIMSHLINKQALQSLRFPLCPLVSIHTAQHKSH